MSYLLEAKPKYFKHRHEAKKNHAAEEARLIAKRLIDDVKANLLFKNAMLALISRDLYIQLAPFDEVVPGFMHDINKSRKPTDRSGEDTHTGRWSELKITAFSNHYLAQIQDPVFHYLEKNLKKEHLFYFGEAISKFITYVLVEKNIDFYTNPYYWKSVADELKIDVSGVSAMSAYNKVTH